MPTTRKGTRTWIWVVLGLVAFVGVVGLAACGAGVYFLVSHIDIDAAPPAAADRRFDETRAALGSDGPLLTLTGREWAWHRRPTPAVRPPATLHVLAWEAGEERVVRLRLPFWLLRLGDDGTVDIDLDDEAFDRLDLTIGDLDRHGPGLIVDHHEPGHGRVLVWTE